MPSKRHLHDLDIIWMLISAQETRFPRAVGEPPRLAPAGSRTFLSNQLCYKIQMEIILGVEGVSLGQLVQEHYLNAFSELFLLQSF
ncbi:hypothetical protein UP17_20755 [Peribacillus simplex]|uniref:hypothetical protein n=1 Tax=Peribacillus simplex TaxID=1478 RepID=UPI000777E265|nr:hypothetical protein [Peribacillus simplex]AMM94606.1 hypothetical protein UP17_20755 [Peribacillus simplex]